MDTKSVETMKQMIVEDATAFWKFCDEANLTNYRKNETYIAYRRNCCDKIGTKLLDEYDVDNGTLDELIEKKSDYSTLYQAFDAAMEFTWYIGCDCFDFVS